MTGVFQYFRENSGYLGVLWGNFPHLFFLLSFTTRGKPIDPRVIYRNERRSEAVTAGARPPRGPLQPLYCSDSSISLALTTCTLLLT